MVFWLYCWEQYGFIREKAVVISRLQAVIIDRRLILMWNFPNIINFQYEIFFVCNATGCLYEICIQNLKFLIRITLTYKFTSVTYYCNLLYAFSFLKNVPVQPEARTLAQWKKYSWYGNQNQIWDFNSSLWF